MTESASPAPSPRPTPEIARKALTPIQSPSYTPTSSPEIKRVATNAINNSEVIDKVSSEKKRKFSKPSQRPTLSSTKATSAANSTGTFGVKSVKQDQPPGDLIDFSNEKISKEFFIKADQETILNALMQQTDTEEKLSALPKLITLIPQNKANNIIKELIKQLPEEKGFALAKEALDQEFKRVKVAVETNKSKNEAVDATKTLFRGNNSDIMLISAYQTKVLIDTLWVPLGEILKKIPSMPFPREFRNKKEQNRLKESVLSVTKTLNTIVAKNKFPDHLKKLYRTFIAKVNAIAPGQGKSFAPQLFFLRFFNPLLTGAIKLPQEGSSSRSIDQLKNGITIAKLIQNSVNNVPIEGKEEKFLFLKKSSLGKNVSDVISKVMEKIT